MFSVGFPSRIRPFLAHIWPFYVICFLNLILEQILKIININNLKRNNNKNKDIFFINIYK